MRKILLLILIVLVPVLMTEGIYAAQTVTVKVTEKVPGAICVPT